MRKVSEILRKILIGVIRIYQRYISSFLPASCRYYPSCSHYAVGAIEKHGAVKGCAKAVLRVLRCNPFFPGGYDPP